MIINGRDTRKNSLNNTNTKDLSYYRNLKAKAKQQVQPTINASDIHKVDIKHFDLMSGTTGQKIKLDSQIENLSNQIQQKENDYVRANNISDWDKKTQAKTEIGKELNELKTKLDSAKTSRKQLNENTSKILTPEQYDEMQKNAPLSQKIDKAIKWDIPQTAEKVGRTGMDLIGNVATGVTKGMEGYVDAAVGVGGTALSGIANLAGKKEAAQNIKNKAEEIAGYGFSRGMEDLVDEKSQQGAEIYKPSILGIDVRDAAQEIARMYAVGRTGGLPGFMVSATGGNIEEALNEGESLGRATAYGAITGSLEGIVEKMFDPAKILGGGLKTIGKGFLGKIAEATVGEGAEEGITAALNPFIKMLTYKGETENPFGSWENFKNYLKDIGQSVYQGAVIGGLTLGVSAPGNVDLQKSFSNDVYNAVEKIQGIDQVQKNEIANTILEGAKSVTGQDIKNIREYVDVYKRNSQNSQYIPQNLNKNTNLSIQRENVTGLPKIDPQNATQNVPSQQTNTTLPTQAEMVQKANTEQITQQPNLATQKAQKTYQSAKIAGMTDVDMKKAIDLNNMLRSGANLEFYDEKNIPQNVQADKAKIANGFYQDGTLWINKNSKNKVEQILGHELTHHLETTNSYTDLSNTILDSDVFYDYISEKGYTNVAEYKTKLKEMGYTDAQMNNEMVARFVEEKLFTDQNSIDRLARQNTKLVEKIKNWISDLVVSFKGTAQEKELLRIENMYRKALEQARNTTTSAEAQYSIAGVKAMENINDAELTNAYNEAQRTGRNTRGWFKDKEGNWKFEISDKDMTLKKNLKLSDTGNRLGDILEHDILFRAYPELRDTVVNFEEMKNGSGYFHKGTGEITLNKKLFNTKDWKKSVEASLIHEIQHAIQEIEGYPGAANPRWSKKAYYESLGEIEASDTKERFLKEKDGKLNRSEIKPRSSEPNPKHRMYDEYMSKRGIVDKVKDAAFPYYAGKGGKGYEISEEAMVENNKTNLRMDDGGGLRRYVNETAGKEPAFSMGSKDATKKTTSTKALSRYAQTLQNKHEDIPEQINLIQKEVDNGNFTHEVIHDKRSLNYAQKYIEDNGFDDAVKHWDELIKRGKPVDKDELALGQMIYNVAVDNKDTRLVMKMASDLVQEYTEIGRNLQSATLLRKMTPDGRLYALERSVQKINQDLMQKFDNFENIQIPEELADKLLRSETQKDMDTAVEQIQEYIASKIPATWQEKLNSWRYLAMLGNPRTHIRNIVGNAVFIPAVEMKNKLAQVGEKFIPQEQRTKATLTKKDAKLLSYAENDFDKNQETIRGENKYDIKSGIQEKRTIYSTGALEAARKGNFKLLEAEDTLFLKFRYKKAFAGALKARGITIEQLRENSPETVRKVNEIRSYAINEAQKATYRDASIVASMVSRGKRKLLNAANQSTGASKLGYNLAYLGAEGVMPFAKTPINIVKRGIEYSPAGLLNGIKNAVFDVKSGKVTAAQAIDKIAAGTTGTAIAALGLWLASMGLVSGGEEEKDKEQALKQLKGNQDYALNIGNKSYTIDWTAPSSIPLFIGVELYNSINSEDESAFLNALSNLAEPVVEMSMLQGLNDTLTTLGEDSALGNIVGKTLTNYLGQYNPTILGQIARSFDPVRRTTYVDKNIPVPAAAQRFIQQQAAKIPGVSRMLPTYKDQFGQEQLTDGVINRIVQNFFSPGYLKDIKEGTVEQGLTELYEKTGETSVIPSYASKYLTHNGEKINLTAKQYDTYAKTRGDLSKKGLEGLFKDNYYKSLSDEQKVKVVEAIYDYAGKIAKTKVIDDYELEFNDKKIQKLQNEGLDFYKYILLKKTADADGNDYTSNDELDKAIKKYGLSRWQKTIKEKNTQNTKTKNTLPTLKQQRAKLPPLKK